MCNHIREINTDIDTPVHSNIAICTIAAAVAHTTASTHASLCASAIISIIAGIATANTHLATHSNTCTVAITTVNAGAYTTAQFTISITVDAMCSYRCCQIIPSVKVVAWKHGSQVLLKHQAVGLRYSPEGHQSWQVS